MCELQSFLRWYTYNMCAGKRPKAGGVAGWLSRLWDVIVVAGVE